MSDLHPNMLTSLAAMTAFNRHDLMAVAEHVHPDFVYRIPGRSNISGEFHGIEGFVEALTRLCNESDDTLELTPLTVLATTSTFLHAPGSPPDEAANGSTPRTAMPSDSSTARSPTDRSSFPTPNTSTTSGRRPTSQRRRDHPQPRVQQDPHIRRGTRPSGGRKGHPTLLRSR